MNRSHVAIASIGLPLGALIAWVLVPYASMLAMGTLGLLLATGLAGVRILFAEGRRRTALARQAELVTLQTNAPVHLADVLVHGVRWADRAQLSAHQVALAARSMPATPITIIDAPATLTAPTERLALPTTSGTPTIDLANVAQENGTDHWQVGYDASGIAHTIQLRTTGLIGIGGKSGSGKTNTATWLAAQAAAMGATLFVGDPHYGDAQSLSTALLPFGGAVQRFAQTPETINDLIAIVWRIYHYREQHPNAPMPPVVLLLDEFAEQMKRQQLTKESLTALEVLADGGRKKAVYGALISTNWRPDAIGSRAKTLRASMTTVIVHRSDEDTARYLLPDAAKAVTLAPGQALLFNANASILVQVPRVDRIGGMPWLRHRTGAVRTNALMVPRAVIQPIVAAPTVLPPPPLAPPTNQQRIVQLLGDGQWRTNRELALALAVHVDVISTETLDMWKAGQLGRQACKRGRDRWEYGNPPTHPTT